MADPRLHICTVIKPRFELKPVWLICPEHCSGLAGVQAVLPLSSRTHHTRSSPNAIPAQCHSSNHSCTPVPTCSFPFLPPPSPLINCSSEILRCFFPEHLTGATFCCSSVQQQGLGANIRCFPPKYSDTLRLWSFLLRDMIKEIETASSTTVSPRPSPVTDTEITDRFSLKKMTCRVTEVALQEICIPTRQRSVSWD